MLCVCVCTGCDGCCVFCLYCEAWSCRCSCMGSVSVSSCRCCMFVSCVHPVAVLNVAFCMTCTLLILVEDARGAHMEEAYCLVCSHECLLLLTHPVAVSVFMICSGLCACTEILWMCVLYVGFGSKIRPRTFGCIARVSVLLCIFGPYCSYILQSASSFVWI